MIELTYEQAHGLLRDAVQERGTDYVYRKPGPSEEGACVYVHTPAMDDSLTEPEPGCIVGWVLHKAGVPLDVLAREKCNGVGAYRLRAVLEDEGVLLMGRRALDLLATAQAEQDRGVPWGAAVQRALSAVG